MALLKDDSDLLEITEQNHWTERGRAALLADSRVLGRPHRSVLPFGNMPDFMNTKAYLVRLLAAVAVSAAGSFFVAAYSPLAHSQFLYEHPHSDFSPATEFLSKSAWVGYMVPAIALLVGLWALRRAESSVVFIEVVIAATWFFSLVWFGSCLLLWKAQMAPVISHMQFHY